MYLVVRSTIVHRILENAVLSVIFVVFEDFVPALDFDANLRLPDLLLVLAFFVVLDNSSFDLTLGKNCFTFGGILAGTNLKSLLANGELSLQKARGTTMRPPAPSAPDPPRSAS